MLETTAGQQQYATPLTGSTSCSSIVILTDDSPGSTPATAQECRPGPLGQHVLPADAPGTPCRHVPIPQQARQAVGTAAGKLTPHTTPRPDQQAQPAAAPLGLLAGEADSARNTAEGHTLDAARFFAQTERAAQTEDAGVVQLPGGNGSDFETPTQPAAPSGRELVRGLLSSVSPASVPTPDVDAIALGVNLT